MAMKTSPQGAAFILAEEGIVPGPYLDGVNVWTYGVGHTAAAGAPDPSKMNRGMPANLNDGIRDAVALFKRDLAKYEADVNRVLNGRTVPQHEFDAAVSFHINTGAIGAANWVDIWLKGDAKAAARNMVQNWRKPAIIIPRRNAEHDLLAKGAYGAKRIPVWPVGTNGRITWKPLRTLSPDEAIAMMYPTQQTTPVLSGMSEKATGVMGPAAIIAAIAAAIFAFFTKG